MKRRALFILLLILCPAILGLALGLLDTKNSMPTLVQAQSPDDMFYSDGSHPNDKGYEEMAKVWLPAVEEAISILSGGIVVNTSDPIIDPDDRLCSLIEAITAANTDTASGDAAGECAAGSGADIISLEAHASLYRLTAVDNTTDGANGLPSITSEIIIRNNHASALRSFIDRSSAPGTPDFRIFHVAATGNLTLDGVVVENGHGDNGGGIYNNQGTAALIESDIVANTANDGGGIFNAGGTVLVTSKSSVVDNFAYDNGGGIFNSSHGTVQLIGSTIRGNGRCDKGGGIFNDGGTVTLNGSTVSDNEVEYQGGGIFNDIFGTVTLINSTVSGNRTTYTGSGGPGKEGGGIVNDGFGTVMLTNSTVSGNYTPGVGGGIFNDGTVELTNTIVAKNSADSGGGDCWGWWPISSFGYNLDSDGSCGLTATGDISNANPLLDELKDHGGPTETHGLFASSPAIDAIPASLCPDTDQRGVPRPQGEGCDIGAFEFGETVTSCEIDLQNNTHTCSGIAAIDFVQEPSNGEVVLKVNLDPNGPLGSTRAVFEVEYGERPTDWTVNIGDSATNNGAGGDCGEQSNDAELHIWDTTMEVYGKDYTPSDPEPILRLPDFVDSGSLVTLEISNERLDWDNHSGEASSLVSPYLYALNGQPDTEGSVNYDIYAAFNRVITLHGCPPEARRGSGVEHVTVTLRSEPTAIDLLSFTAQAGAGHVTLAWETGTEVDNAGFNLWRAMAADGPYTQINGALIPAEGDPISGASYVYIDSDVDKRVTYYYKLEDVDYYGVSTFHGPVSARVRPRFRRPPYRPTPPGF